MIKLEPMTIKELAEKVGCSANTVRLYISRAEFSHIKVDKLLNVKLYNNITNTDINRLRELIHVKRKFKQTWKDKYIQLTSAYNALLEQNKQLQAELLKLTNNV